MANLMRAGSEFHRSKRIKRGQPRPALSRQLLNTGAHFPADVLEHIFSFLPIKDAVQTSVVSTRFKESWAFNRKLLFGRDFYLRYNENGHAAFVDRVISAHKGSKIQTFELYINPYDVGTLVEKWVRICIEKGIEELNLYFAQLTFIIPSDLLESQTLKTLKLANCKFQWPPVLRGLSLLQTLHFRDIDLKEQELQALLLHCKLLKSLELIECTRIRQVNISAPNHKHFKKLRINCCPQVIEIQVDAPNLDFILYNGIPIKIQLAKVFQLRSAIMNLLPERHYLQGFKLENLVIDLSDVRVFTITATFLEALASRILGRNYFKEMIFCFAHLKELQVYLEGATFCSPFDVAMFLKSCPFIERLFIDVSTVARLQCRGWIILETASKAFTRQVPLFFHYLKFVKLTGLKFEMYEIELVKLILERAISLRVMVFVTARSSRIRQSSPEAFEYSILSEAWKASPDAELQWYEYCDDRSVIHPYHVRYNE